MLLQAQSSWTLLSTKSDKVSLGIYNKPLSVTPEFLNDCLSVKPNFWLKNETFHPTLHVQGEEGLETVKPTMANALMAQKLKHLPPMWETRVRSLGWEDPLEKEMVTHSSILAWRIPWTEKPGRLQSTGSQRVGHDWATSLSPSLFT